MRFSIVIATYNRAASLRQTLLSLRHQTHTDFEVIVVNNPSTDGTEAVLAEFAGQIRVFRSEVVSLTVARNIGLAASAGDAVAFIDDDAIPTPTWLQELAVAYREPNVGAVGGLVYDNSGVHLQYRFAACNRDGSPLFHVDPPLDQYLRPMADPVAYLQGTNISGSRAVFQEIGGFDENIVCYFDDVEMCMQVIDRGYKLKCLDGAAVHHKFLPSNVRNNKRVTLDPYSQLSGRVYFALRHGRGKHTTRELIDAVLVEADRLRKEADDHTRRGDMTAEQRDFHHRRIEEALEHGLSHGLARPRAGRVLPDPRPETFLRYPVIEPTGPRLKLCFISREYPPGDFGGPGRYTHELAAGFAQAGHEAHVVTRSPDIHRVDFEDGVWVHRLPAPDRLVPELDGVASNPHIFNMVGTYHEVCRIHAEGPIDLVSAPLWLCEGLVSGFDDRFPTTTTLITGIKAVSTLAKWAKDSPECQQLAALEEELVAQSQYLHAVSAPILTRAMEDFHADPAKAFIANLGIRDRVHQYQRRRPAGRVRVLYVGRVETRKGADLFLEAATRLCREFPDAEFVLAGKEVSTDDGDTYRQRFETAFAHDADMRSRVIFTGMVSEDELYQHYADADVVCLPSRYESFGLVLVEAMFFGKPVIGARAGGMVEVVADGEQGYLIPPGDADSLTDSLRQLIADVGLRERFGRRSRELYEQRFSVPVMVAQCERHFRAVIGRHRARPGWNPKAPPPRERVSRFLADTLSRVAALAPDRARAAAEQLLNPLYHPVDFPRHFQKCWHLPPAEFATATYHAVLGRHPRADEVQYWVDQIEQKRIRRLDVVWFFADAFEAKRRGVTTEWIGRLEWACGGGEFFAPPAAEPLALPAVVEQPAPAPAPPRRRSLRARLSELGPIGKLFKYMRRTIYLPWNFHKYYHEFANGAPVIRAVTDQREALETTLRGETQQVLQALQSLREVQELLPLLRQLMARQEGFRELLWKKEAAIAAGQDELRALLNEQIAQVTDTLTGIAEVVEFPPSAVADRSGELPDVALPSLHQRRHAG
jgi:glycosyltransferase involved in cell wall biosynthesis/GT2 family glycosyltransferase